MAPVVAVVGASCDRRKFGNKAVRAHVEMGYTVYPVNPKEGEVEGLPAFPDLTSLPGPVDRISMYVPPAVGITMLPAIVKLGPKEFFLNPGTESPELVAAARELGLAPIEACSILDLGTTPEAVDEALED